MVDADAIHFLVQRHDFELGLEIDFVIEIGGEPISHGLPVLRHQDNRRLHGGDHGQDQIEKNIGIGVERLAKSPKNHGIGPDPSHKNDRENHNEGP